jgi:2-desacetyl-2-hydroxyethyl bacteriochlorophyllide A dehydrogenase
MRAAVFRRTGQKLSIETLDDPTPGPGEAVIAVGRCGVCGTDLHMTSGHGWDFPAGTIIGHEFAGEVVAIGKDTSRLKIGDRVTAMPAAGCGHCGFCIAGHPLLCPEMRGYAGGCADFMRIAESSAVILPSTLTMADGALVEPLAVGLHGVALAALVPGARVLMLGAGAVGLAAIFWAARLGAGRIVAASRSARRADLARQMGAYAFVQTGEGEKARIEEALGGTPDVVFECAGAVGLLGQSVNLVKTNGLVISMGFCTAPDPVIPGIATFKQVTIKFSMAYTLSEFEHVARRLDAGDVEPRAMITETIGLDEFPDAFEALRSGAAQTKLQVRPSAIAGGV